MDKPQHIIADCEVLSHQFMNRVLAEYFKELESRLLDFADKAKNNQQQWQLLEVSRRLKDVKMEMEIKYLLELKDGFRLFLDGQLSGHKQSFKQEISPNLSLVADDTLEVELAQSSFARRAETRFNEDLYALHQRLSILMGGKKITENGSPIGPTRLAACLERILPLLSDEIKIKVLCYKVFEKHMLLRLGDLYKDINQSLIKAGVLPNLRYSVTKKEGADSSGIKTTNKAEEVKEDVDDEPLLPPGAVTGTMRQVQSQQRRVTAGFIPRGYSPAGFQASDQQGAQQHTAPLQHYVPVVPKEIAEKVQAPKAEQPSENYQQELYAAIRTMQKGIVRPQGWRQPEGDVVSGQELVSVLSSAQSEAAGCAEQLDADQIAPCDTVAQAGAVSQRLQDEIHKATGKNINEEEANTIDLVGMIFEYMLGDDGLPDNVKAVLSYMHTPFLKIAFLDEALFAKPDHPARLLLNALEETGSKWVNNDGTSQFKAFPKIKGIVRRVLMEFHQDFSLVEELLKDITEFNDKVQRNVELLEKRAAQKAEGEDKLKQVKKLVHKTVKGKIDGKKLPSPIVVLLLHPWSEYLTFLLLRYGESSEKWQQGIEIIDNILWSITPKPTQEEQKRLVMLQENLQEDLKQGFNSIAYDMAKANKLLDAIGEIHSIALQNRSTQAATAQAREEIELTAVGHEEAQQLELEPQTPEEKELVEKLRMVEFGSWMEFDEIDGLRNQRLKIAWFNSKTLQYMLVNRAGKQAAVLSAVEIARHMLEQNARMISGTAKPFFERALENIFSRLQASAA